MRVPFAYFPGWRVVNRLLLVHRYFGPCRVLLVLCCVFVFIRAGDVLCTALVNPCRQRTPLLAPTRRPRLGSLSIGRNIDTPFLFFDVAGYSLPHTLLLLRSVQVVVC